MKFQKLTIHNIASIEDAVIDFEAQPLADSEVFLITGKTGAGKSTILDAICLALFANTPRLNNTMMQGNTKDGEQTVQIKDPRQLMRRNTGKAFVSLTFVGANHIHYEASWSIARAREKVTGNIQAKHWELKNLDTNQVIDKDNEIQKEIKNAIGLDFKQFCRTTLLAQGEFTRFLNSSDTDKAEILEKITGADIYSKIGAKVFNVTRQKELLWKKAQQLVQGTPTLSDEEKAEKQATLALLDAQYKEIDTQKSSVAAKRDWITQDEALVKEVAAAHNELNKATQVIESEAFKSTETFISDWNATIDARRWLSDLQAAEKSQTTLHDKIISLAQAFSTLLGGQQYAEQELASIASSIAETDDFLNKQADKVGVYRNAQTLVTLLNTIDQGRATIQQKNNEIQTEQRNLNEQWLPALDKSHQEATGAKESLQQALVAIEQQEAAISAINLTALRKQSDDLREKIFNIRTAKERIEALTTAKVQRDEKRRNLSAKLLAIDEKKAKWTTLEMPLHDAQLKMEVCKNNLDRQKETIDKFAQTLRLKLRQGDICPVCGQTIANELPHEEDLAKLVAGLQDAFDQAEKQHRSLDDERRNLEALIKTDTDAYNTEAQSFNNDTTVVVVAGKAQEACRLCGIEQLDASTLTTLDAQETISKALKEKLDKEIGEGEAKEKAAKEARNKLEAKRKEFEKLEAVVKEADKAVTDSKGRIATASAIIDAQSTSLQAAEQQVAETLADATWSADWQTSPKTFATELTAAANKYVAEEQRKQTLTSRLQTAESSCMNVAAVVKAIGDELPKECVVEAAAAAPLPDLLNTANTILTQVTLTQSQWKQATAQWRENKDRLDTFLADKPSLTMNRLAQLNTCSASSIAQKDAELKQHRDAVVSRKSLLDNIQEHLIDHRQQQPLLAEGDSRDSLTLQIEAFGKQLATISEQKGAIHQVLQTDQENRQRLGELKEAEKRKKCEFDNWSILNQLIGDAGGNKFRKIAQSYVLADLIHNANYYMKTLTDRYTLKVTPGTFVISIEDAYQGFVSRAASTISGGESFLVSLSLALALSDIGQRLRVDTLFIDEGFGTLSGEPLQKAINTLRTLHQGGRRVGIISHVEELQERIPVQIRVEQDGNNSSSTIRIVP